MVAQPKVALVIGSGGIKCAAAIGLWKVLHRSHVAVDMLVGCSGGSIYAACIALGHSAEWMTDFTTRFWTAEIMKDYTANLRATQDGSLRFTQRSGLVDDSVLNARLRQAFGERRFEDCQVPLMIVASDLHTGDKVTITEGELFQAIRASVAIPTIFPPWESQGRLLVDGAASDPLPVDLAIRESAQIILAMGFMLDYRKNLRSLTGLQLQLTNIYTNNMLAASYAFHNLAHHAELIPIIPEFDGPLSMSDGHRIADIVAGGERAAERELPRILQLIES